MEKITSACPSITQVEIDLVSKAIRDGWQEKMSWYIEKFTSELTEYIGTDHCLTTSHCTDAIHLAMIAMEIGPGDEVIVPDLTWVASVAPILYVGATPVFADVDQNNWCLTAETIERRITSRTKAVVVVDLLGNLPEWEEILDLCRHRGIRIIEDAAEGIGATYNDKMAGSFGEVSVFSFNATKLVMSGHGGAFCTDDSEIFRKAKLHSHHGIDKDLTGRYYWSTVLGYNYSWTNIQAALALAQLRRIDELLAYKKWLFSEYKKRLLQLDDIQLSAATPNVDHTFWISVAIVGPSYEMGKEEICHRFTEYNIDIRPLFYPISAMPPYQQFVTGKNMEKENPVTYFLSKYGICLPNGNNLKTEDIDYICDSFKNLLNKENN